MMQRLLLVSLLAAGGCFHADVREIPTEQSASMVLVWTKNEVALRAAAVTIAPGDPFITVPFLDADQTLYIFDLPCPLAGLGLSDGPVTISTDGFDLPKATRMLRANASAPEGITADAPSFRYTGEPESPCIELAMMPNPVPGSEDPFHARVILPLEGDALLIGVDGGFFYKLTEDGAFPNMPLGVPTLGGARTPMGLFTFAGSGSDVVQVTFDNEPSKTLHNFPGRPSYLIAWVDSAERAESDEVFVLSDRGSFAHFRDDAWVFSESVAAATATIVFGGLARIGPGEALLAGAGDRGLMHYRDGAWLATNEAPIATGDRFISIVHAKDGVLLGTEQGAVFAFARGAWSAMTAEPLGVSITVLTPLGEGLLAGGPEGLLFQIQPGWGTCPKVQVTQQLALMPDYANLDRLVTAKTQVFGEYRSAQGVRDISRIVRLTPNGHVPIPRCE